MTVMNLADHPSMLPEATADELVERLIWQVTGAADSNRREALLTWAGLRGLPPTNDVIAAAHHVARGTVNYWTAALARAAATITLTSSQREQLIRPTLPGEDHKSRLRRARIFRAPEPARLESLVQPVWWRWARIAERLIAAAGPLTLHQLHAGVSRARARRHETVPIDELGIALLATRLVRRAADHWYRTSHPMPPKVGDARLLVGYRCAGGLAARTGRSPVGDPCLAAHRRRRTRHPPTRTAE